MFKPDEKTANFLMICKWPRGCEPGQSYMIGLVIQGRYTALLTQSD